MTTPGVPAPPGSAATLAGAAALEPRDSKVLNVPELQTLIAAILRQKDPRVRLSVEIYRQFLDDVAQAVGTALSYAPRPADWIEEWLISFHLTEDSPADGGILPGPGFDADVQDEFMAGVAARRADRA